MSKAELAIATARWRIPKSPAIVPRLRSTSGSERLALNATRAPGSASSGRTAAGPARPSGTAPGVPGREDGALFFRPAPPRGGMGAFQEQRQVLIASPFAKFAHAIDTVARNPY